MKDTFLENKEMTEKKPKKKRKRRKKRYLLKFILLVAFGTGVYYFLTSPLFDIQKLTVIDNHHYTTQQVISIAEARVGVNLFKAPTTEMKDKLLNDPYIKNAKVERKLPDELIITVEERQEAAAVPYGDQFILIDHEGMILRKTDVEPTLTLFTGMTLTNIEIGTPLQVEENSMLAGTLELIKSMEEYEIFFKKIDFSNVVIKAYIYDNLICEGTPENILKSMDDLKDVLYDLYVQGIERGVIKVGGNGYYSFSALVEE
ncbi:MAG: cell division protein FtsQ/DivIB [Anaerovoracaceae bacterium]